MSPTPFSNNTQTSTGSYTFEVADLSHEDSENSEDAVKSVNIQFTGSNGTKYLIDAIQVIHKPQGAGDHPFFGGVGLNKVMHGNSGIGTNLMPKMTTYITLWGTADLKDGSGNVLAEDRLIHIMVAGKVRDENLNLITSIDQNLSDLSPDKIETHIMLPPQDMAGNMSPVSGTGHGFLHLMFESVDWN